MADHAASNNHQNQRENAKKLNSKYSLGYDNQQDDYDTCSHLLIILGYSVMIITFPVLFFLYLRIAKHYERAVIFRLGRLREIQGPGLFYVLPLIDRYKKVDLRLVSFQIPVQEVLSRDMVSCELDGVVFFRINDPIEAVISLENAKMSTKLLASTTIRSVVSSKTLAEIMPAREAISKQIQSVLDHVTTNWGIKIERFEIKNIHLPTKMKQSLAAQTEVNQESHAKLVAAEAEALKAESLGKAAQILSNNPGALQLRYLQSLDAIGSDQKSNIVWPLPMDMMGSFYSSKSSFDQQPPTHSEFNNYKRLEEERQPRPEATTPPKVVRKEQPLSRPPHQNSKISATNSSGTFVPITNAIVPVTNSSVQAPSAVLNSSTNQVPGNFNLFQTTVPASYNHSYMSTNTSQQPQATIRLSTPPVTSTTIASNNAFVRPSSALTSICSSDEDEEENLQLVQQPVQQPAQTPVFNYVH